MFQVSERRGCGWACEGVGVRVCACRCAHVREVSVCACARVGVRASVRVSVTVSVCVSRLFILTLHSRLIMIHISECIINSMYYISVQP